MNKYDAEIRLVDTQIERLYTFMEDRGLNQDTRWIILADHGEGLRNHGLHGHDRYIYQEQLEIPLIFHRAGSIPQRPHVSHELVRQVDVLPTVLDWIGLSIDPRIAERWEGVSLAPLLTGRLLNESFDFAFSQRRFAHPRFPWTKEEVYALQDREFKYIYHGVQADEFYDLTRDPLELDNLIDVNPELAAQYNDRIQALTAEWSAGGLPDSIVDGDGHVAELEALGYITGD